MIPAALSASDGAAVARQLRFGELMTLRLSGSISP
jgi:hypothetical protein